MESGKDNIEEAVTNAVESCINEHVMEEFLSKEKAGVIAMHVPGFNEELHKEALREEGRDDLIKIMLANNKTAKEISDFCGIPIDEIKAIEAQISQETNQST